MTKYISCGFVTAPMNSEVKGHCSATVGVREVQQRRRAYGAETGPRGTLPSMGPSTAFDCERTIASSEAAAERLCVLHATHCLTRRT